MRIITLFLSLLLTGCYVTTGPGTATATLYFRPEGRASLFNRHVDGIEQGDFSTGYAVSAGSHHFEATYEIKKSCPMFSIGCFEEIARGSCSGELLVREDNRYFITVRSAGENAEVSVLDDSQHPAGTGNCVSQATHYNGSKFIGLPRGY